MKMGNGGFNIAYNIQFATDTKSQIIVGVDAGNSGSDYGQMTLMMEQLQNRYGKEPEDWLIDPGYRQNEDIIKASIINPNCNIYMPPMQSKNPKKNEGQAIEKWRKLMGNAEAKIIYRERAATSECVNALARNRGLQRFLVRGLKKVKCVSLIFAITHNFIRGGSLSDR